jgi:glutamate-ammonia-ligase adenylyltransferase
MRSEFSVIPFEDRARAEANVADLERRLAASLMTPLASLLAHSPDPDGALNLLERYARSAPAQVIADLERFPTALTYLVAIFGYSRFLAETFLAEPALPLQFARDRNFAKLKSKEDLMQDYARFSTTSPDPWLAAQLARFKRRNYLRIVLKDVLGLSTLGETTLELSTLADVILTNALLYCDQELEKRYGQPQYRDVQSRIVRSRFSILSLGKLGGNELNYSSDIDLLFLYSHDGETAGGSEPDSVIANKEYFVRLAHAITRTITQVTPHGMVFRVDLRLRPEGEQGDLAISLKSALEYYEHRARDWELQMLIKARHSAGDTKLTREFLRGVEPYIYHAPTDFEAIESVLWAREKLSQKIRESRDEAIDVKLHRGGIRDIEFLTQCLQRLHGGQDTWVRSGGTLFALRKLNDKGWLSDADYASLTFAYEFLRKVEHRIQLEMGHQTHRLPMQPDALDRLGRRVGVDVGPGETAGSALRRDVQRAFARVTEIYQRVIHPRLRAPSGTVFDLKPSPLPPTDHSPQSFASLLSFLSAQAPNLANLVGRAPLAERGRRNITRFLSSLLGSSEHFALATERPACVERALPVLGTSEYLAELLIYHPETLTCLDRKFGSGEAKPVRQLEIGLEPPEQPEPFCWALDADLDMREKMALLRQYFRECVLQLGATDLEELGPIFSALDRWSGLAGSAISNAVWIAVQATDRELASPERMKALPFAVLGLGRLGLKEFDLGSDADLVFVAASATPRDEVAFWTRVAGKIIEVLSSYTREGTIFAVDTRLRPGGQEGELVTTEEALLHYLAESAQVWEALTYLKACPVAGNFNLAQGLREKLATMAIERFSSHAGLEDELKQMRRRLEREMLVPPSNTKTAPGGYYDIDFAVSYLRLRNRIGMRAGANTAEQIQALRAAGFLSEERAGAFAEGAAVLRTVDHAIRLVTGRAADGLPEHVGHAEAVSQLAHRWGLVANGQPLAQRLREIQQKVRSAYRHTLGIE